MVSTGKVQRAEVDFRFVSVEPAAGSSVLQFRRLRTPLKPERGSAVERATGGPVKFTLHYYIHIRNERKLAAAMGKFSRFED